MKSYQGIGTSLYGKINNSDGSYTATKWFSFLWFPIFPITTYQVWEGKTDSKLSPIYSKTEYRLIPKTLSWRQIIKTYLLWWGGLIILIAIYLS